MANIKNRKKLQLIQTIWDVMLYSQHFTFHWKLLGLVSRIEKSGTGDNNFGKWKGTFRSDRPKWPDRSQWTTFKAGPEYSGRTKPKWSVPFDEPTEISGILGYMESAPKNYKYQRIQLSNNKFYSFMISCGVRLTWLDVGCSRISEVLCYLAVCTFPDLHKLNSHANDL